MSKLFTPDPNPENAKPLITPDLAHVPSNEPDVPAAAVVTIDDSVLNYAPVTGVAEPSEFHAGGVDAQGRYVVGTLRYTGFALMMLFIWLLWGDFVWTLMETCVSEILPLKMKEMGASDTLNQVLNGALSNGAVFLLAPTVSVASDRHRGRLGRRIPYLFWSTPIVGLFLILMGCYGNLTHLLIGNADGVHNGLLNMSRAAVALTVFGVMFVAFDIANVFCTTIYWYLFNDVVPVQFLSRFLSLFRVVGGLATLGFARWVLPHSLTHFRVIFVTIGIAYVIGYMAMCIFVREGRYPPPPPLRAGPQPNAFERLVSMVKMYAQECFTHRLYWCFFLTAAITKVSYQANRMNRNRDITTLGVTMDQTSAVFFYTTLVGMLLQVPAGWLADKYNPLRVLIIARWISVVGVALQLVWLFTDFGQAGNLKFMYVIGLGFLPFVIIAEAAEMPMYMRLLPKDRYGQFCSANAMIRALAVVIFAGLSGVFLDWSKRFEPSADWHYRLIPVWTIFWQIPAMICLMLLYKEWKKRGGDSAYTPP